MSLKNSIRYLPGEEAKKWMKKARLESLIESFRKKLDEEKPRGKFQIIKVDLFQRDIEKIIEGLELLLDSLPDPDFSKSKSREEVKQ